MKYQNKYLFKLNSLSISILLSLSAASYADVQITNSSVNHINQTPVVNIDKANSNGVSHNYYSRLNVNREGVVFNNSQYGANTTLAGYVGGNANLSSGTAKVIINEVISQNKSALNGYMEVAGDKAYLIISNPNGITCTNCGFINTSGTTLTTGKVDVRYGELKGYSVNGGNIEITNLTSDSPTAILTRSAVINGSIRSKEITIVTGTNYVNSSNQVAGSVASSGGRNTYSIDISKLGGMYANKISLVSTESGVGVRNEGIITAGHGGISLDGNGHLINISGKLKSASDVNIYVAANIDTMGGQIEALKNINISTSGHVNNTNGKIIATKNIAINAALFANNYGVLSSNEGSIALKSSDTVYNGWGTIKSQLGSIDIITKNIYNGIGLIQAKNIDINAYDDINNQSGTIAASTYANINAKTMNNNYGVIHSDSHLTVNTKTLSMYGSGSLANNTATGIIRANDHLSLNVTGNTTFTNYGWILGRNIIDLTTGGALNNKNTISANSELTVNTIGAIYNSNSMVAGDYLYINTNSTIYNDGFMLSDGFASIKAKTVTNNSVLGGYLGLTLNTLRLINSGRVLGL